MEQPPGQTTQLQAWLDRHLAGDPAARAEIVARSCERLRQLTHRMLRGSYSRVARWEQTDDVLQTALIRLHRALDDVAPESVPRLFGLAATLICRTLLDLARHHFGPEGAGGKHETGVPRTDGWQRVDGVADADEPQTLADWTAFHEAVESLPADEQQAFSLIWYNGLTQTEVADLLNVNERTIRRRWTSARLLLHAKLKEEKE
jgi:RNA polymerase sigma factor (sigma-70 family)